MPMSSKQKIRIVTANELKHLLQEHNILQRIHSNEFRRVEQACDPAKMALGGTSYIVSYYQGNKYICTKHEIVTLSGEQIHQDIEDALIDGVRYKRRRN